MLNLKLQVFCNKLGEFVDFFDHDYWDLIDSQDNKLCYCEAQGGLRVARRSNLEAVHATVVSGLPRWCNSRFPFTSETDGPEQPGKHTPSPHGYPIKISMQ